MSNKYNPQGRTRYLWVKTLADPTKPKKTELATTAAGVLDLSCGIRPDGVTGFSTTPTQVDATSICSKMEESVAGLPTTDPGSLQMLRASTSGTENFELFEDLKDLAAESAEGYVVRVLDGWNPDATPAETGPDVGDIVDVFPSEVTSINADPDPGSGVATYTVGFNHPAGFILNVPVVANGGGG